MQTTFLQPVDRSNDPYYPDNRGSFSERILSKVVVQKGETTKICYYLNTIKRTEIYVPIEEWNDKERVLQNLQRNIKKFERKKMQWVAKACKEIQDLVRNEFFANFEEKMEEGDFLLFKATDPLLPASIRELNAVNGILRKKVLIEYIDPEFNP